MNQKTFSRFEKFKVIIVSSFLVFIITSLPIIAPDQTIQCVSAPCQVPNISIIEWVSNQL